MEVLLILFGILTLPFILFVIPMVYADNQCKGILEDLSPNHLSQEHYTE